MYGRGVRGTKGRKRGREEKRERGIGRGWEEGFIRGCEQEDRIKGESRAAFAPIFGAWNPFEIYYANYGLAASNVN